MATKDLTIRIRADFGANGAQLTKALEQIQVEIGEVTEGLENAASAGSKAMETIGLGAQTQLTRLQKLQNGFQGFTSSIANGADRMAKAMAPWNQAIELGEKAIRFFDAGLDAAAKKYPEHAKDVEALRKQFGGLKEDVMAAVGVMTVELLRPVRPLELLEQRVDALRKKLGQQSFFGGDNEFGQDFMRGDNEAGSVAGSLGSAFDGFTKSLRGGVDFWDTRGTSFVDSVTEGMKKTADATRKASVEAARWRAELAALSSKNAKDVTDELVKQLESETAFSAVGSGLAGFGNLGAIDNADLSQQMRGLSDSMNASGYEQFRAGKQKTFLEGAFGPIEDFNAYAAAFQMLSGAVSSSMQAWITGSMGVGDAFKKFIGEALGALASQMGVEALKHGAYALGSLAFGDVRGAGQHAVAAGAFTLGAGAAAAAAKAMGHGGTDYGQAGGGRDHRGGDAGGGGRGKGGDVNAPGMGQSRGERVVVRERTVIFTDPFFEGSPSQRREMSKRAIRRAGGGTGWSDD